jgi:hypothetical protein
MCSLYCRHCYKQLEFHRFSQPVVCVRASVGGGTPIKARPSKLQVCRSGMQTLRNETRK